MTLKDIKNEKVVYEGLEGEITYVYDHELEFDVTYVDKSTITHKIESLIYGDVKLINQQLQQKLIESYKRRVAADENKISQDTSPNPDIVTLYSRFDKRYNAEFLHFWQIVKASEIEDYFGINLKGIHRRIHINDDSIVLISPLREIRQKYVSDDYFTENGDFMFVGEGNDAEKDYRGANFELGETFANVYLFIQLSPNKYLYQGKYHVVDAYKEDKDNKKESVIRYRLESKSLAEFKFFEYQRNYHDESNLYKNDIKLRSLIRHDI